MIEDSAMRNMMRIRQITILFGVMMLVALFYGGWECFADGKHPTFQVRGGSVYTYGFGSDNWGVNAGGAVTRQIGANKNVVFASWAEHGAFSNGYISGGFASGAATGVGFSGGGSNNCLDRALLTFANNLGLSNSISNYCPDGDGNTGLLNYEFPRFNFDASVEKVTKMNDVQPMTGSVSLPQDIDGGTVNGRKVVVTNDRVAIDDNIQYGGDYYGNLEEVPKLLIYAKKGIDIACGVTRVDAILFTAGDVNTCYNPTDSNVNSAERSVQLVINGAIIASRVNFQRTYGAVDPSLANPANDEVSNNIARCQISEDYQRYCASVPAEIVNYDVSILSAAVQANVTQTTSNLVTIYQRELPPRY